MSVKKWTVRELIEELKRHNLDDEVVIAYENHDYICSVGVREPDVTWGKVYHEKFVNTERLIAQDDYERYEDEEYVNDVRDVIVL